MCDRRVTIVVLGILDVTLHYAFVSAALSPRKWHTVRERGRLLQGASSGFTRQNETTEAGDPIFSLGDVFATLNFEGFNLSTTLTEENCRLENSIFAECFQAECPNFAEGCPSTVSSSNKEGSFAEGYDCTNIQKTICDIYGQQDECCMKACALELQNVVVCGGATQNNQNRLDCDAPLCHVPTENTTTTSIVDLVECQAASPDSFSCTHRSNITSFRNKSTNTTKQLKATLVCNQQEPASAGFDISLSSDCRCDAVLSVGHFGDRDQFCPCELCDASDSKLVSVNCSQIRNTFVIDDCVALTCNGDCIVLEPNHGEETDAIDANTPLETTESPTANRLQPTLKPSVRPSIPVSSSGYSIEPTLGQSVEPQPMTGSPSLGLAATSHPSDESSTGEMTLPPTMMDSTSNSIIPPDNQQESSSVAILPPLGGSGTEIPNSSPQEANEQTERKGQSYGQRVLITIFGPLACTCFLLMMLYCSKQDKATGLQNRSTNEAPRPRGDQERWKPPLV